MSLTNDAQGKPSPVDLSLCLHDNEDMAHPANFIDLTGQRFGRLVVIKQVINKKYTAAHWECRCDCGTDKVVFGKSLRRGMTGSCGCVMRQTGRTHGLSDTRVYKIWEGIKARCLNANRKEFKNYGGRGIKICDRWLKFEHFYADMGEPPKDHCIDRIDNDGNYAPGNCRWTTREINNNNQRDNIVIIINGVRKSVPQWCKHYGVNKNTAYARIIRGWNLERAVSHKVKTRCLKGN